MPAAPSGEGTINVSKPIQIPAWALVVSLAGGGGWLTWQQAQGAETAVSASSCHDLDEVKEDVAALKAQMTQMDARLARIENILINGSR
jgi:hypothetical protein